MKLKPSVRFFGDEIYRVSYVIACCPPAEFLRSVERLIRKRTAATDAERKAIMEALETSGPQGAEQRLQGARGVAFRLSPESKADVMPFVVIWLQPGASISVLVHEAWHAAFWVLRRRGVTFDDGDDIQEPVAYYLEWIVKKSLGG